MTPPTDHAPTVVGVGAVSGYGWGVESLWKGLKSGKDAAALVPQFGRDGRPGWVVQVPDTTATSDPLAPTRFTRALRAVAQEAIADARGRGWVPGPRVGLVHATVLGDLDMSTSIASGSTGAYSKRDYLNLTPSTVISTVMTENSFTGPATTVSAMCASGVTAFLTAKSWLDAGRVDDVLVVSTDLSATPHVVDMFVELGTAVTDVEPSTACRPFQADSLGFLFGEAAAAFVMTARTQPGYAHILGGAMSHDAFHPTSVDPSYTQVKRCVSEALEDARVGADDVAFLAAHGPGTKQCDRAEATVAAELLPAAKVYTHKPLIGHCQAAAAAVELAAVALGYAHGEVAAAPMYSDPIYDRVIGGVCKNTEGGVTVKTSLGLGGHNAALVLAPAA